MVKDNQILIFDFDDCEYKWFISDIAISLYWLFYGPSKYEIENKIQFANNIFAHFMAGYQRNNTLPKTHLNLLLDFIKLRDMYVYIMIHQMSDVTSMDIKRKIFTAQIHDRILGKMPYIQLNL